MLQSLHVKNIALIDDVEIEFEEGLNILSGETGAGKSILIDSVNFALGGRVNKDVVRDEEKYALSELVFHVDNESIIEALEDMGVVVEDNEVILQRRISNGKSNCRVNGESVPAAMVKDIAALLIDIHGQHEHQSLLYKKNHKLMLDSFCGDELKKELTSLKSLYKEYKDLEVKYDEAISSSSTRQQDLDYSQFVVNEIENARLTIGEDEELENDFARMNNARKIAEALANAKGAIDGDDAGVSNLLSHALMAMKQITAYDDSAIELYDQLASAEDIIQDFIHGLYNYEESLEFSQEEYLRVENRLNEINRLKDKYGRTIEDILKRGEAEATKIEQLNDLEGYISNLELKKSECYGILCKVCQKVSDIRKSEGALLAKEIVSALNNLNFLDAHFEIRVTPDENRISSDGFDDVEFMISTNPGEDVKELTQVASGGELSRIMLALKSVLAKKDAIETLIFDEIDTGISGKTAQRVADRMSDIAQKHQVICITHLPQIASHANAHFLIEKSVIGERTQTEVKNLSYDDSVEEIARMLAGETITDAVRENAREMKKIAKGNI